jgi:hypothetical protein
MKYKNKEDKHKIIATPPTKKIKGQQEQRKRRVTSTPPNYRIN